MKLSDVLKYFNLTIKTNSKENYPCDCQKKKAGNNTVYERVHVRIDQQQLMQNLRKHGRDCDIFTCSDLNCGGDVVPDKIVKP